MGCGASTTPGAYDELRRATGIAPEGEHATFATYPNPNTIEISRSLSDATTEANDESQSWSKLVYAAGALAVERRYAPDGTASEWYHHRDHLGSLRIVTDEAGRKAEAHDWYPYGQEMASWTATGATTRKLFTGHERDAETGLDYMLARYYASPSGAFLTVDPLGRSARPSGPKTWNRYSYALGSPVVLTDPTGMDVDYDDDAELEGCADRLAEEDADFAWQLHKMKRSKFRFHFKFAKPNAFKSSVVEGQTKPAEKSADHLDINILFRPQTFSLRQVMAHEVQHAFDFLTRQFCFTTSGNTLAFGLDEEERAFEAQLRASSDSELAVGGNMHGFLVAKEHEALPSAIRKFGIGFAELQVAPEKVSDIDLSGYPAAGLIVGDDPNDDD